jgi:hypothetical protein
MSPQENQFLYSLFEAVVIRAVIAGFIILLLIFYPWWYINKKGKEAGLDDFTISQWRWKALWLPWLAFFQFRKYLETLKKNDTSHKKNPS